MAGFQTNNHVVFFPAGFLHYGDISRAVSKAEAQALGNIIDEAVRAITPDAILTLTGGFRRYKTCLLLSVLIFEDETQRHLQSFLAPPHPHYCSVHIIHRESKDISKASRGLLDSQVDLITVIIIII